MKSIKTVSWIIKGIIFFICLSCNNYSVSEKQIESFLKYYAIDIENTEGVEVIQNLDGGYVILANYSQEATLETDRDILIIYCDEFGRMSSNSPLQIGTNGFDQGNSIIRSGDGFIIAGSSLIGTQKLGYLSKIGNNGQQIWQQTYGGYKEMEFNAVIQHQDGGYIMTGYFMNENDEKEIILYKTDSNGDSLWVREMGYTGFNNIGESLERYQDRLLIIGTNTPLNPSEHSNMLILNTNLEGRGIFALWITGEEDLIGEEIVLDPDGDLYIMGNEHNSLGDSRIYLARLQLIGDNLEEVELDYYKYLEDVNSVWGEDLESTEPGSMAICGWESSQNDINIYFINVDNNFQVTNRQTYGSKGYQATQGLYYTNDEGYSLTGSVDLGGGRTSILLKLDREGKLQ